MCDWWILDSNGLHPLREDTPIKKKVRDISAPLKVLGYTGGTCCTTSLKNRASIVEWALCREGLHPEEIFIRITKKDEVLFKFTEAQHGRGYTDFGHCSHNWRGLKAKSGDDIVREVVRREKKYNQDRQVKIRKIVSLTKKQLQARLEKISQSKHGMSIITRLVNSLHDTK
jgi:hypothetical protein